MLSDEFFSWHINSTARQVSQIGGKWREMCARDIDHHTTARKMHWLRRAEVKRRGEELGGGDCILTLALTLGANQFCSLIAMNTSTQGAVDTHAARRRLVRRPVQYYVTMTPLSASS